MTVKLNSDKEFTRLIREKLKENDGYCPCALEKVPDTKCMCKAFRDMMERGEVGICHCGLYIIKED